jgi:hypothetical protein
MATAIDGAYFTLYGTTNSAYINKFEVGVAAGKVLALEFKSVAMEEKVSLMKSQMNGLLNRVGIGRFDFEGEAFFFRPSTIFCGILLGMNQIL